MWWYHLFCLFVRTISVSSVFSAHTTHFMGRERKMMGWDSRTALDRCDSWRFCCSGDQPHPCRSALVKSHCLIFSQNIPKRSSRLYLCHCHHQPHDTPSPNTPTWLRLGYRNQRLSRYPHQILLERFESCQTSTEQSRITTGTRPPSSNGGLHACHIAIYGS
jgi:hypothetical protein